jgi:hypothetical protein
MKLSISTNTAKVIAKALPLALEKTNTGRQHLTYVQVADIDGVLTFTATNGYIAFSIGVDSHGDRPTNPFTVQGKELCKALADIAKTASKLEPTVSLSYGYEQPDPCHSVKVSGQNSTVKVMCADIYFPPVGSILADKHDNESGVLLNGKYFTDIVTAATLCAGDSNLVTVESLNTCKAGRITADSKGIQFTGVIMPCRQDSKVGK